MKAKIWPNIQLSACDDFYFRVSKLVYLLVKAQVPISNFFAGPNGEISKSKMSIGRPRVIQALGIFVDNQQLQIGAVSLRQLTSTKPATCPWIGAQLSKR